MAVSAVFLQKVTKIGAYSHTCEWESLSIHRNSAEYRASNA